ncbi:hypothetical protein BP5796_08758 [Coleophoma crateriformis]|uniref:Uncharacterized protein n=1 Tax=Coleophoma crateriformis TaxID=565419 RepID=A0A3D8R903_9HELO|nr:hypothetical protein BP5796_08758 [Coleophoma crateriformis]
MSRDDPSSEKNSEHAIDTNKYLFGIHKYRQNHSYLRPQRPPSFTSSQSQSYSDSSYTFTDEKSAYSYSSLSTMGASEGRYSLLPRLSMDSNRSEEERSAFLAPSPRDGSKKDRQFTARVGTLRTLLRTFTSLFTILSIVLLSCFFRRHNIAPLVFLSISLAEQILVLCFAHAESVFAFRIRFELKKNDWKRARSLNNLQRAPEDGEVRKRAPEGYGVMMADLLVGLGVMSGSIVMVARHYRPSGWPVFPFSVMFFQFVLVLLDFMDGDTSFTFIVQRPREKATEPGQDEMTVPYQDLEQGDATVIPEAALVLEDSQVPEAVQGTEPAQQGKSGPN